MIPIKPYDDAYLVPGQDDTGKEVIVNSVGGFLKNEQGIVIYGPFQHPYEHKFQKFVKGRMRWIVRKGISEPNWYVHITRMDRNFSFMESEVTIC